MASNIKSDDRLPLAVVALVCLGFTVPSLSIGLLSDDFSWLRIVRDSAPLGWADFLAIPSPYGYFRPVPMALFRAVGFWLPGAVWPFRVLMISLHLANCLLIYLLGRRLGLGRNVSLVSSLLFAVMPGHAESLFWISALNEPLASFLVLLSFYLLLSCLPSVSIPISTLLLTLALATRESAFCYIPLLLLLLFKENKLRSAGIFPLLLVPGLIYLTARYWWLCHMPPAVAVSSPGQLSLNPLEMGRRLFHYLAAMALPIKTLFELVGFGRYDTLRSILTSPGPQPLVYWSMAVFGVSALMAVVFFFWRLLDNKLLGPLAFIVLSLGVYLPFRNTAEHFLYFPSIGFCFLVGLLLSRISSRRASVGLAAAIALFSVYAASRVQRLYRWHRASAALESSMDQLSGLTAGLPKNSPVLVEGLDNRYFGLPFVGEHSLGDAWSYRHPDRPLVFYFDRTGRDSIVISYSPADLGFRRLR